MKKKTVSLVLGSGGARGYAHIGVIEEILSQGLSISSISGSSIGALIGGLFACGKLDEYKKWVTTLTKLDVLKLLDISFSSSGIIKGDKVFKNMDQLFGKVNIEDLPINFTAVATNITTKKEVWFQKGNLADAVRASVSIPTIFTPKKIDNYYYIDGGVLNPLPVSPTISDITDYTICVNLNANTPNIYAKKAETEKEVGGIFKYFENKISKSKKKTEKLSYFKIMQTSINIMQTALTGYKTAEYCPDIMINIPLDVADFYEFYHAKEIIEVGRKVAKKALEEKLELT